MLSLIYLFSRRPRCSSARKGPKKSQLFSATLCYLTGKENLLSSLLCFELVTGKNYTGVNGLRVSLLQAGCNSTSKLSVRLEFLRGNFLTLASLLSLVRRIQSSLRYLALNGSAAFLEHPAAPSPQPLSVRGGCGALRSWADLPCSHDKQDFTSTRWCRVREKNSEDKLGNEVSGNNDFPWVSLQIKLMKI